jgi:lactate permease
MFHQILAPVGGSLTLSALVAVLPLLTLFVLLGAFKTPARWAALAGLIVSLIVAITVYSMPPGQAISGALEGAATGFFPIFWVAINAIWLYNLTEESGHFAVLRRAFSTISDDPRAQAIIIAFCFGALLEALAGGGSPVAICAVMLIALGFNPLKAATVCLVANTSPVAFGALGLPIATLAKLTKLPVHDLATMVGRQTPLLALFIPFILVGIIDGRRGLREMWPVAAAAAISFSITQSLASYLFPVELVDICSALVSTAVTVGFLRIFRRVGVSVPAPQPAVAGAVGGSFSVQASRTTANIPARSSSATEPAHVVPSSAGGAATLTATTDSQTEVLRAFAPYLIVLAVVIIVQIPFVNELLSAATMTFAWPGLGIVSASGKAVTATIAKFEWLTAAGTLLLFSGLITAPVLGLSFGTAARLYAKTLHELRWAIFTVCCIVGIAYVMNLSGQTITLGVWAAGAGAFFPLVSPIIGWFGTALTGSDTSANALFGVLQVTTAQKAGLSPVLLAAANTAGGVCGKAVSPQNLAIAAVAVKMSGREGDLFRRVAVWSVLMVLGMSLLVFLQSTSVLSWMVP